MSRWHEVSVFGCNGGRAFNSKVKTLSPLRVGGLSSHGEGLFSLPCREVLMRAY